MQSISIGIFSSTSRGCISAAEGTPNVLFFIIPDFSGIVSPFEFVSSLCVPRILYLGYCHVAVKKKTTTT